ncbi:UDP-N-acetylmuramoyl-L-alanine--D-glutamate ligase [Pseudoalteromonas carrageenovora]|uniref:UDP-N-acetylmuramoyl-L-alanine--D-glutamate ligase n=1 Tax=Pseudoalteromonas TaxID=53246 RepID=UPI000731F3A2|nr:MULTISPECIES: UDP-N-acetylmuramoyl-L-alanine--D-glutamate ligase [Pseudoalteromonas]KTF17249.1 UDP-N-acetylmuramoylalanine--D-glutamate ligase [Pseudoalteromonas sp. H103]MDO6634530.1 UDP-N-acetylmuramoyl-L-alanine--D-glutamate ligase [Pseudoalteromonas carrageenovora]MDO6648005.1 UDP-N-acetylmuramoyl-L-alanine--D-glutamate ligase [Pseudoalteromonas carrageenovora]
MQYLNEIKNKQITVLGLGVTGLGIVRFLLSHGFSPKVIDSRKNPPGIDWLKEHAPQLSTHFGNLDGAALCKSDMIIISPGLSLKIPAIAKAIESGVEVIGDVELFARINTKPVVAVTGSNGKSTVVTLAYEVLKAAGYKVALGGNIGTAVLDLLSDDFDVYVLELSSFQLDTSSSLKPISATVLNVSEDHLDRYDSYQAYIDSKLSIYNNAELIVINADDIQTKPISRSLAPQMSFGTDQGDYHLAEHNSELHFIAKGEAYLPVSKLAVVGKHNYLNTLSVMALLSPFNITKAQYTTALSQFHGLAHRCQFVSDKNGVKYFNDSKATNVGATIAAIDSLASEYENLIVIAGGDAKGADLSALKPYIKNHVKALVCFGKDANKLAALTSKSHLVNNMQEAVALAQVLSKRGDIVLLAPACASIDMYNNYMQRGDDFVQCVVEGQL